MASVYTINGQPATKEQYDAFIAANPTLASASDLASAAKIANPPILGESSIPPMSGFQGGAPTTRSIGQSNNKGPLPPNWQKTILGPNRDLGGVLPGAQPRLTVPVVETNITTMNGQSTSRSPDLRVKLRVPNDYLTQFTSGSSFGELSALGGIIFPYTPQISFEHKADYSSQTPTHSNYAIHFYKNSSVGDISINGKFTVQNESDALIYISTVHLLRALTKMRFGGPVTSAGGGRGVVKNSADPDSGAPPPVCRLDAYGEFMLKNVPVVITSFKADLPDAVDFYTLSNRASGVYGQTSVPTVSTIQITCKPIYSRAEMQSLSVTGYLNDPFYRRQGFL
jgi:hypothetical protein